jgi:HEAT repeat protein
MFRLIEHFWRLLPAVRRAERGRVAFFIGLFTLVNAAQTVGLAGTEALFLSQLGAAQLPLAFLIAALTAMLGSAGYAAIVGSVRNDTLFLQMLAVSGAALSCLPIALPEPGAVARFALIAAYYLTQCVLINHFWTFAGDYFDTLTSKRLVPVFALGSSVGGLLGGAIGVLTAVASGPLATIAVWGVFLVASAAALVLAHRPLRRWGPLAAEEADETSLAGLSAAVRFVPGSRLARWLLVGSLGMVLAQFVAQYIYSDVFVRSYPDSTELTVFLGAYLAISNLVEVAVALGLTPWLIRRFGVAGAHVAHPVLTVASFVALFATTRLDTAVAARGVRELAENSLAQPVRALVFNALPARLRGRIRAFFEGVVVYGGMSIAGALLLALETPSWRALAAVGGGAALLYLLASLGARRAYLDALIAGIRSGRLDLGDLDEDIGAWEVARLSELCDELLRAEFARPSRSLLQLIASLGQRGAAAPLLRGLDHSHALVRVACARALAGSGEARTALGGALSDRDADVRLAALEALSAEPGDFTQLLDDPDPRVRALAAARSRATIHLLVPMLDDSDPGLHAAALEQLAVAAFDRIPEGEITRGLADDDARVRSAALRAAARAPEREGRDACDRIARSLRDPVADVRRRAAESLASAGAAGAEAALAYLGDASESTALAALDAVAAGDHPRRRQLLSGELRRRVGLAWHALVGLEFVGDDGSPGARLLRAAIRDTLERQRRAAFRVLELLESPRVVRRVARALRYGTPRAIGDALEVLSNLGDRTAARWLVLLYEPGPLEERAAALGTLAPVPASRESFLASARATSDRWVQRALAAADRGRG